MKCFRGVWAQNNFISLLGIVCFLAVNVSVTSHFTAPARKGCGSHWTHMSPHLRCNRKFLSSKFRTHCSLPTSDIIIHSGSSQLLYKGLAIWGNSVCPSNQSQVYGTPFLSTVVLQSPPAGSARCLSDSLFSFCAPVFVRQYKLSTIASI